MSKLLVPEKSDTDKKKSNKERTDLYIDFLSGTLNYSLFILRFPTSIQLNSEHSKSTRSTKAKVRFYPGLYVLTVRIPLFFSNTTAVN